MKLEVKIFLYLLVFCFAVICFNLVYEWTHKTNYIKEDNKEIEIRESPSNMDKIYKNILEIENNNLKKCIRENKSCTFEKEYINYLKESLNYKDILEIINIKYSEITSDYIKENQDLIELDLDKKTTLDLLKINSNYLKLDNSRKRKIYYEYLKDRKIIDLIDEINNSKNDKNSALLTYQIFLLFSNEILYLN